MLSRNQCDAGVHQRLLSVQHIERGSLASLGLFANAVQSDFGGSHLRLSRRNLRLAGDELSPGSDGVGTNLVPHLFEIESLLRQAFLGLPYQCVLGAALIDWD